MGNNDIYWSHSEVVGYDATDGMPIFQKVGSCDSSVTLPTGADARYLADGSIVTYSDNGNVNVYNRASDAWVFWFSFKS